MHTGIAYLSASRLQRCLSAGLHNLIAQQTYLNQINVFPVPDGDTGNNLAQTARAGLQVLTQYSGNNLGELVTELADAMLDNAQGNSGALLAQFFQGFATSVGKQEKIGTLFFATAITAAAIYTRTALDDPREGTILSAIDASAQAADKAADTGDFTCLLPAIETATQAALKLTTAQLEVLEKAGVVDAGAAGYCAIIEGCTKFLREGSLRESMPAIAADEIIHIHHEPVTRLEYRYCTECLVSGAGLDAAKIRAGLHTMGDSLVIAGSSARLRIHIHTNNPEEIFRHMAQFGELQKTKADDMQSQYRALGRDNHSIAIVTDSAADIPEAVITELDIHMVPLRVSFGDKTYLDKIGMSPDEFRHELNSNFARPGTSQPSIGDFSRKYEFLTTHFSEVVSISLSSKLSGTYQASRMAASRISGSERITLIDSKNVSVGQGLIVKYAAELAMEGLNAAKIQSALAKEIASIRTFALVTDLNNAVRSGRLQPSIKRLAEWLRLTPILTNTLAGKVGVHRFIFGHFQLIERFVRHIAKTMGPESNWEIAVAYGGDNPQQAELLKAELHRQFSNMAKIWHTDIGPAFGVHAGMDALVVALRKIS